MKARVLLPLVALVLAAPGLARADAVHDCVEAANSGQALRDAGKLDAAHRAFVSCSADACPSVVHQSCERWDAEIAPRLSTVTFVVTGPGGEDLADARVSVDGAPLPRELAGRAVPVDPGAHEVVVERAGFETFRQRVVVREGDKGRVIAAKLGRPPVARPVAPARPSAVPLVVSGSVAAVGLGAFAVLGLVGQAKHDHLAATCAPSETCDPIALHAARDTWIAADVSLAIGIGGAAVFTAFAIPRLLRPRSTLAPTAVVAPGLRGASVVLRWQD